MRLTISPQVRYNYTIQVYSWTVMILVKALQAGQSSQGTSEPITPVLMLAQILNMLYSDGIHSENSCTCWVALPHTNLVYCPVLVWMSLFLETQAFVMSSPVLCGSFGNLPRCLTVLTDRAGRTSICKRK